jgi:uncharacterized membrane protein YoaK (UPF0700 family)
VTNLRYFRLFYQMFSDRAPEIHHSQGDPKNLARARRRATLTFPAVGGFFAGCAAGGFLEVRFGLWGLLLPVVLAATAVLLGEVWLASPEGVR